MIFKNENSKSSKNSKLKMYILPINHVVSTKMFQRKILYILGAVKKINLTKFWNSSIQAVGWRMWGG
jgi:hypothetical protein